MALCVRTIDDVHAGMRLTVWSGRGGERGRVPCGQRACESVSRAPDPRLSRSRGRAHIVLLGCLSVEQVGMVCELSSRTKGTVLKLHNQEIFLPFRTIMHTVRARGPDYLVAPTRRAPGCAITLSP